MKNLKNEKDDGIISGSFKKFSNAVFLTALSDRIARFTDYSIDINCGEDEVLWRKVIALDKAMDKIIPELIIGLRFEVLARKDAIQLLTLYVLIYYAELPWDQCIDQISNEAYEFFTACAPVVRGF